MPTDVERLAVLIEANTRGYETAMKKVQQQTDAAMKKVEGRFGQAQKRLESTFGNLGTTLSRGLGALGVGLSARELIKYADAYTNIQNALKVTGLEGDKLNAVYGRLYESAQRNAVPLGSLAALYGRVSLVSGELGVSQEQLIGFTDRIALAIRVSGTTAEQASGSLTQLSQALGGGVVRAEEFNSMMEGTPTIVQAVARGITEAGGSVAKLRQLVVDGKVSSKAFFDAYMIGSADLERSAGKMGGTVAQAMTRLNNAFTNAIGEINKVTGTSETAEAALNDLAKALKWIADNVTTIKGPYDEIAKAIRGVGNEASTAAKLMARIRQISPAGIGGNIGAYVAGKMGIGGGGGAGGGQTDPADESSSSYTDPIPTRGPLSVNDPNYKPPTKPKDANTVGVDSFARSIANAEKRIAVEKAETEAVNLGTAARERAKLVAELQAAAVAQNTAEGLKNTEVTAAQNVKIQDTADKMYAVAQAAEAVNGPMARAARSAMDLNSNVQSIAVSGIDQFATALTDIADGSKTAKQAFADLARSVIRDLTQMIIKAMIYQAISAAFGMPGGGGGIGAIFGGGRASGGPVMSGTSYRVGENGPEMFTPRVSGRVDPMAKGGGGAGSVYQDNRAYSVDARGATPDAVALAFREIRKLRAEVPEISRATMIHDRKNRPGLFR